jgi:hypothetical protein
VTEAEKVAPFPFSPESRHVYFWSKSIGSIPKQSGSEVSGFPPDQSFENLCVVFQKTVITLPLCHTDTCQLSPHLSSHSFLRPYNYFRQICNSWKKRSVRQRRRSESGRLPRSGTEFTMSAIGARIGLSGENLPTSIRSMLQILMVAALHVLN